MIGRVALLELQLASTNEIIEKQRLVIQELIRIRLLAVANRANNDNQNAGKDHTKDSNADN